MEPKPTVQLQYNFLSFDTHNGTQVLVSIIDKALFDQQFKAETFV